MFQISRLLCMITFFQIFLKFFQNFRLPPEFYNCPVFLNIDVFTNSCNVFLELLMLSLAPSALIFRDEALFLYSEKSSLDFWHHPAFRIFWIS